MSEKCQQETSQCLGIQSRCAASQAFAAFTNSSKARRGALGRHTPGSAAYAQQPAFWTAAAFCGCERSAVRPSALERSTVGEVMSMCQVPAGTSVCEWPGALAPGAPRRCVREGSMSAMERTTYRRSVGSNTWAADEPRRDPQHAPHTSGPSTDFSSDDDSIPSFLPDLQGQPDPREFAPLAEGQRTSILTRVVAGGLVVSAFAILVAVGGFNSNVTRVLIDKARVSIGSAAQDQSPTQPPSHEPASVNTPSRENIVSAYRTALQSQAPAARTENEAPAPSKTLDAETFAPLMTRAN